MQSQLLTWIDGSTTPPERSVEITRLADAVVRIATIDTVGLELPDFPPLPSTRWQDRIRRSTVGGASLDRLLSLPPPALGGGLVAETFLRTLDAKGLDLDDLRYWQLRMVASSLGGEIDPGSATRLADGLEHLAE